MSDIPPAARSEPPAPSGRTTFDTIIVAIMALTVLGFFAWFGVELLNGLGRVPENLPAPQLFRAYGCVACHSMEGGGGSRGPGLGGWPAVARTRAAARSDSTGETYTAADFTVESILQPDATIAGDYPRGVMRPQKLRPAELRRLVAWMLELKPDDPQLEAALVRFGASTAGKPGQNGDKAGEDDRPPDPAAVERGKRLFHDADGPAACLKCHAVSDDAPAGLLGPSLAAASLITARHLRESILEPGKVILPSHRTERVFDGSSTVEGELEILAWPTEKSPGRLALNQPNGRRQWAFQRLIVAKSVGLAARSGVRLFKAGADGTVDATLVEEVMEAEGAGLLLITTSPVSLMPSYKSLSAEQVADIVAYLQTLGRKRR